MFTAIDRAGSLVGMKTLYALGLLICIVMVGWFGQIPDFLQTVEWEPPSYFLSAPRWNVALAWFVGAVFFGVLYTRRVRADARARASAQD
jgi:hypothetical protein